jgi:glucose/arabinose dehydrogenase
LVQFSLGHLVPKANAKNLASPAHGVTSTQAMKAHLLFLFPALTLLAADPEPNPKELPRIPFTAPKDALKTFKVKEGFELQLAAAEPLVADPVAMCFDEFGRMFVVEMIGYSERQHEKLGRVRRLVDTNGDGRFDKSTIFAKGLAWPTAVFCSNGGVYVGVTPDLFFSRIPTAMAFRMFRKKSSPASARRG